MTTSIDPIDGRQFYLKVGDGAGSEVFSFLCVATTISDKNGSNSEDAWVPNCSDPALPAERVTVIKGLTKDLTGSGLADPTKACYTRLWAIYRSALPGNFQTIKLGTGGETVQFPAVVTDLSEDTADRGFVKVSFTLKANGVPVVTPN